MGITSANFIPASDQHTGKVPALSPSAMSRPSRSKTPNAGKIAVAYAAEIQDHRPTLLRSKSVRDCNGQ
jgi:hypothetical protein